MLPKSYLTIILISILSGFLIFVSPALFFCFFLTSCLFYVILKNTSSDDRVYILTITALALALRLTAVIILQYNCTKRGVFDIFWDAQDNITRGFTIADSLTGASSQKILVFGGYNTNGLTYFNGIFFALFGKDVIALKYINFLCILAAAWLIYDLTVKIYSALAGRIAMAIILFWPTLFIWSLTDLKENHSVSAIAFMLWIADKVIFKKGLKKRLCFLLLLSIVSAYFVFLRLSFLQLLSFYFIILSLYNAFRWYIKKTLYKEIRIVVLLLFLGVILFLFKNRIFQIMAGAYGETIGRNMGFLSSGGFNYDLLGKEDNFYTIGFFMKFLFGSWFHFLLEPLPWHIFSFGLLINYSIVIIWYFLLFFSLAGIFKIRKHGHYDRAFSPLIFIILAVTALSMSISNIGTAIRLRDNITPIIAMFAACGMVNILKIKEPDRAGRTIKAAIE